MSQMSNIIHVLCLLLILATSALCGCSSEKVYEIVTERGLQEGWVLVLPGKLNKEADSLKGRILYSDKRNEKQYKVPFTFSSKMKYAQYLAYDTYLTGLPVEGGSSAKATATIEMRAGGILGKNMSVQHPIWREMEKRGLKEEDIIDVDALDIVIKDNTFPYHELASGRYPYLVPK